ncbi:unnamed protein product [Closterium sp. Naga37s-1]|nr:unnamed protein product [Closterium sp. Naga37s-1]
MHLTDSTYIWAESKNFTMVAGFEQAFQDRFVWESTATVMHKLTTLKQKKGQTVTELADEVRQLASYVKDYPVAMMVRAFIERLEDPGLREKVLGGRPLSLEAAEEAAKYFVTYAQPKEKEKEEKKVEEKRESDVDKITKQLERLTMQLTQMQQGRGAGILPRPGGGAGGGGFKCYQCGKEGHMARECPNKGRAAMNVMQQIMEKSKPSMTIAEFLNGEEGGVEMLVGERKRIAIRDPEGWGIDEAREELRKKLADVGEERRQGGQGLNIYEEDEERIKVWMEEQDFLKWMEERRIVIVEEEGRLELNAEEEDEYYLWLREQEEEGSKEEASSEEDSEEGDGEEAEEKEDKEVGGEEEETWRYNFGSPTADEIGAWDTIGTGIGWDKKYDEMVEKYVGEENEAKWEGDSMVDGEEYRNHKWEEGELVYDKRRKLISTDHLFEMYNYPAAEKWNYVAAESGDEGRIILGSYYTLKKEAPRVACPAFEDLFVSLNHELGEQQQKEVRTLLVEYRDIFSTEKETICTHPTIRHHIATGNTKPIAHKPYRVSPSERARIEEEVQTLLKQRVIRPSNSPCAAPAGPSTSRSAPPPPPLADTPVGT